MMQCAKTELRTATDLAAKGAADELARTNSTSNAVARGQAIAPANRISGAGLQLDAAISNSATRRHPDGSRWMSYTQCDTAKCRASFGRTSAGEPDGPIGLFFGSMHGIQNL